MVQNSISTSQTNHNLVYNLVDHIYATSDTLEVAVSLFQDKSSYYQNFTPTHTYQAYTSIDGVISDQVRQIILLENTSPQIHSSSNYLATQVDDLYHIFLVDSVVNINDYQKIQTYKAKRSKLASLNIMM